MRLGLQDQGLGPLIGSVLPVQPELDSYIGTGTVFFLVGIFATVLATETDGDNSFVVSKSGSLDGSGQPTVTYDYTAPSCRTSASQACTCSGGGAASVADLAAFS